MSADAARTKAELTAETGLPTASQLDDWMAWGFGPGADERPLVSELTTAAVVREALAALRQDMAAPLEEPLVPGMYPSAARPVVIDSGPIDVSVGGPIESGSRPAAQAVSGRRHVGPGHVEPGQVGPGHSQQDHSVGMSWVAGAAWRHRHSRLRLRRRRAWLPTAAGVLIAVGIGLAALNLTDQPIPDGQPGVLPGATPAADAAQPSGTVVEPRATDPDGSLDPAPAGTILGSASATVAPTVGTSETPAAAAAPIATAPIVVGQQPAVVSALDAGDQGFGWPSSAFGTAGG